MLGRRLPAVDGKLPFGGYVDERWLPGDYCGPLLGYTGDRPSVTYRLPNGRIGHVCSPPHTFRECPDGSLEIRNSILHTEAQHGFDWHGYLNAGNVWDGPEGIVDAPAPAPPPSATAAPPPPVPPTPSPAPAPTSPRVNEAGWPI